eukprot:UN03789
MSTFIQKLQHDFDKKLRTANLEQIQEDSSDPRRFKPSLDEFDVNISTDKKGNRKSLITKVVKNMYHQN